MPSFSILKKKKCVNAVGLFSYLISVTKHLPPIPLPESQLQLLVRFHFENILESTFLEFDSFTDCFRMLRFRHMGVRLGVLVHAHTEIASSMYFSSNAL